MAGASIFILVSFFIVVFINYRIYKLFYFKVKEIKLFYFILSALVSFLISLILVDTLDPISRIIEGLILNYKKVNIEGIMLILKMKYISEFWLEDIIQFAIVIAPVSLCVTLIIDRVYKIKSKSLRGISNGQG